MANPTKVTLTAEELLRFFSEDEPADIALYLSSLLTTHGCVSLIKEIQAYEDPSEEVE
jgi:hypothetical protein